MKRYALLVLLGLGILGASVAADGCGGSTASTTTTTQGGNVTSTSTTLVPETTTTEAASTTTSTAGVTSGTIIPGSANVKYTNNKYGFSLLRPKSSTLVTSGFTQYLPLTGKGVVGIVLPKALSKGTNLGEAALYIGASSTAAAKASWNKAQNGETSTGTFVWNGVSYAVFTMTDAGAGNLYDMVIYRTLHKGVCFEVVELLHSSNIGNYPAGTVKEFDKAKFQSYLAAIVSTLKFK